MGSLILRDRLKLHTASSGSETSGGEVTIRRCPQRDKVKVEVKKRRVNILFVEYAQFIEKQIGWGARIRTSVDGARVHRPTARRPPNVKFGVG